MSAHGDWRDGLVVAGTTGRGCPAPPETGGHGEAQSGEASGTVESVA